VSLANFTTVVALIHTLTSDCVIAVIPRVVCRTHCLKTHVTSHSLPTFKSYWKLFLLWKL